MCHTLLHVCEVDCMACNRAADQLQCHVGSRDMLTSGVMLTAVFGVLMQVQVAFCCRKDTREPLTDAVGPEMLYR